MKSQPTTQEAELVSEQQALTIQQPLAVTSREENPQDVQPTTSAQAKIDAIANLTIKCYERAATLIFTPEEIAALEMEFPDEAFKLGAGGDANLIYIEHAHLRDRLNKVFKPGQWAIIPRNRWAENFKTAGGDDACRVYVEAMLVVRGAFVAEAVGDMVYYLNNAKTNYGDAVEGAKSACLRRCAKELGIGLQAWKKDFCEGWKARNRGGNRPTVGARDATRAHYDAGVDNEPPTASQARPKSKSATSRPAGGGKAAPASSGARGGAESGVTVTDLELVDFKEEIKTAKQSGKNYTLWSAEFATDSGAQFFAGTIQREIGEKLQALVGTICTVGTKPGKYEGSYEIVSIVEADALPM